VQRPGACRPARPRVVAAFIATAFAQDDAEAARAQWRGVADQLRPKLPKLAAYLDAAETDVLAYMTFPAQHRVKLHSTNPLERLNGEIKRRTDVVGIFPMRTPSRASSGRCCWNRTTNGPCSVAAT
jgi:transposase-like protein